MKWNSILGVSLPIGFVVYILQLLTNFFMFGEGLLVVHLGLLFAGIVTTGFVLPKEKWGLFIGTLLVVLVPFLLMILLDPFFGASIAFRYD